MRPSVFFLPLDNGEDPSSIAKKTKKLFDRADASMGLGRGDFVAVKTHFGEQGNTTFLHPLIVKAVGDKLRNTGASVFLTETSTLYRGRRANAVDHAAIAWEHGFGYDKTGMPLVMADGLLGDAEIPVEVEGTHFSTVHIAREISRVQGLMVLSHFKGHVAMGVGGSLKNVGMGLASRRGKRKQHSVMNPRINGSACTGCGLCVSWCPRDAIVLVGGKARIDEKKCIGCGECLAVCRFGAVQFDWRRESRALQEMCVEHAAGVLKAVKGKAFFFNFLINITQNCDCMNGGARVAEDIGVLASGDIVALEKASFDIFKEKSGKSPRSAFFPNVNPVYQIEHAARLGLGSMDYEIVQV